MKFILRIFFFSALTIIGFNIRKSLKSIYSTDTHCKLRKKKYEIVICFISIWVKFTEITSTDIKISKNAKYDLVI